MAKSDIEDVLSMLSDGEIRRRTAGRYTPTSKKAKKSVWQIASVLDGSTRWTATAGGPGRGLRITFWQGLRRCRAVANNYKRKLLMNLLSNLYR
jgi:hypothetical protein